MVKIEDEITVKNVHGLHARPASIFVQIASKFDAKVALAKDNEVVDGKSIIAILSLGINSGTKVRLIVEGDDAHQAFYELKNFLEKKDD
ncbi:MAG: HPr family phosphocarrier protein [Candidatus Omnitrophica bacterium]|nr:HPr family phosphocarrier protein [Candidatus Omnitrophota bacterium]MCM8831347.1 HPr family phosphocarrier protein [Candidatus Omnitrophota bacterium]